MQNRFFQFDMRIEGRNWNMDIKYGEEKLNSRLMARFTPPAVRVPGAKLMDEEIKALFCFNSLSYPINSARYLPSVCP